MLGTLDTRIKSAQDDFKAASNPFLRGEIGPLFSSWPGLSRPPTPSIKTDKSFRDVDAFSIKF
jgi:hypothetical protein